MFTLAAGLSYVDLGFLGQAGVIATGMLQGAEGVALVDPGPSTTLPALRHALAERGFAPPDVRAILLTHIHLDHAGATGSLCEACPNARVFVHARGAPHVIDPARLLASARRLYGDEMDRLWGEVRPVPPDRVHALEVGEPGQPERLRLDVAGHDVEVAWTPGHAWHHVSYFLPAARLVFVGDTAGLCRQDSRVVLPATPPPDIDLAAWRDSTERILAWDADTLFLTHFGPHRAPRVHVQDLWRRLDDWSRRVRARLEPSPADPDPAASFMRDVFDDLARQVGRAEAEAYTAAGRFDFSWTGLARYWRTRDRS